MKPGKRYTLLIFAAMCTLVIAIMKAGEYRQTTQKEVRYKCTGYTVVDANHVRTCEGDTIKKDWQILKRYNGKSTDRKKHEAADTSGAIR